MNPLTHHEILTLIAPFARRGRHVDLGASDRILRRLAFKPVDCKAPPPALAGMQESLRLEQLRADKFRLTRFAAPAGGPQASLEVDGEDLGEMLERIDSVQPAAQFRSGAGYLIALHHRLEPAAGAAQLVLAGAVAQLPGMTLSLTASPVKRAPADLELTAAGARRLPLPEDLLAVLGWNWALLRTTDAGWMSRLNMRGLEPARSRRAEAQFERGAAHLARTLAEPPARFHERLAFARWGVFFRRAVPLLVCIALIAGAAAVPKLHLADNSGLRALIFNAPPILMMLFFCMHEVPRIEIPPPPRRPRASAWREANEAA